MSNLVQGLGCVVEAGMKGLVGLAEGLLSPTMGSGELPATDIDDGGTPHAATATETKTQEDGGLPSTSPPPRPETVPQQFPAPAASTPAPANTLPLQSSKLSLPKPKQDLLVQTLDVPSGWIHLQATYLDGEGGSRRVRSFGLKNLVESEVELEVDSDLQEQLVFWLGDDEKSVSSSASSTSSVSTTAGSPTLHLTLPPLSTSTICLAFQPHPSHSQPATPPDVLSPTLEDANFTPRVKPVLSRTLSTDLDPIGLGASLSDGAMSETGSAFASTTHSLISTRSHGSALTGSSRRNEPVHRAFSVHGSISIRAVSALLALPETPSTVSYQIIALPFFATVCRSLFTAAPIEPCSGLVVGAQQSSGELKIDFGTESVVGGRYHRDILLVNRSEIELVWSTTVVNAPHKDAVWFQLRDLDSENVFGVDHSAQPMPLPALSSRHLRLELRVLASIEDFDFGFIISNMNQSGNVVTCTATGSAIAEERDESLKVLSGNNLDFGQITDGIWARQMVTCKNAGDKPLDVKFSASQEYDVVFRLAGVAGEDIDEDLPMEKPRSSKIDRKPSTALARTSTRDSASLRDPHAQSRGSSGAESPPRGSRPSSIYGSDLSGFPAGSGPTDPGRQGDVDSVSAGTSDKASSSGRERERERDHSLPPSRSLSRVASRTSSYQAHPTEGSDSERDDPPLFSSGDKPLVTVLAGHPVTTSPTIPIPPEQTIPNQIEEVTMRPGTEYRIFVLFRPKKDNVSPAEIAGALRKSSFKVYLDWTPSASHRSNTTTSTTTSTNSSTTSTSAGSNRDRRTINCTAESCTSLIKLSSGNIIDFGQVTVGAAKSTNLAITNLSALSAKIEIAAISKVLSTNRNVVVIPPWETVEEKMEFFPRRINEKYEKQIFVRNLLNRENDQLVEIRSKNVDVYNLTLHSHLYRILTPSGSNFLDFGSVVINSPSVRTVHVENLSHQPLVLDLSASQPEDIELYVKAEDEPPVPLRDRHGRYAEDGAPNERVTAPPNGELKERFMETLQEMSEKNAAGGGKVTAKGKAREKSASRNKEDKETPKQSIGAVVAAALKKGGRGRPVQLYGNAVVFKDRSLLETHEYLDLASGPPMASHRMSPRSKRTQLLDSIELEDKSKLSGQHPKVPKLDFAAGAKAIGTLGKEGKAKRGKEKDKGRPNTGNSNISAGAGGTEATNDHAVGESTAAKPKLEPSLMRPNASNLGRLNFANELLHRIIPEVGGRKSPALTAKRAEPPLNPLLPPSSDPAKMSVDELLLAIESHETKKSSITHSSLEEEEAYVKRSISLKKELQNLVNLKKLVPARLLRVPQGGVRGLIVIMTPNGSIRPHISTRAKRADSRVYIKLVDFDRTLLAGATAATTIAGTPQLVSVPAPAPADATESGKLQGPAAPPITPRTLDELPIRDLIIRSSCVRSVLEVQQSSINFGACDKGEVKSKTIVIHNKSDCIGLFRLRLSGSIASGDLKLGLGRYGVISAFGRKEVPNFSFTPSLVGNYQETIVVENVLDGWNDQNVLVKAAVRRLAAFTVDPAGTRLDFGLCDLVPFPSLPTPAPASIETSDSTATAIPIDGTSSKILPASANWPKPQSLVITNVSKHEKTFIITLSPLPLSAFAQLSLKRDEKDAGTALSKSEEEEVEGILQKLKIARRKGKVDKVAKYENRLKELGVKPAGTGGVGVEDGVLGAGTGEQESAVDDDGFRSGPNTPAATSSTTVPNAEFPLALPTLPIQQVVGDLPLSTNANVDARKDKELTKDKDGSKSCTTLSVTLAPSQKTKILVELVPSGSSSPTVTSASMPPPTALAPATEAAAAAAAPQTAITGTSDKGGPASTSPSSPTSTTSLGQDTTINATITIHDRKNTDETVTVAVVATAKTAGSGTTTLLQTGSPNTGSVRDSPGSGHIMAERPLATNDPLHLALMRHCLALTLNCTPTPTAFCVGSTLFLPSTSKSFKSLSSLSSDSSAPASTNTNSGGFKLFFPPDAYAEEGEGRAAGLILGDGWSRQIPGNTHAEANALTNFREAYQRLAQAQVQLGGGGATETERPSLPLPPIEEVLEDAECYATMEPCSIRTSGGPSCALELVRAKVNKVYLGVEEPPDFVQCEGVRILSDGGVKVIRVSGLEEECLSAARRGRN